MVAISSPVVQAIFGYPFGELGYHLLFSICHQYPLRSFWILDHPMAVCARCTGGYFGVALGIIVILSRHNYNRYQYGFFLVLSGSLFALGIGDAILKTLTGIDWTNAWRLSTGLLGGMGFSFLTVSLAFATAQAVGGLNLRFGRQK
jgi:uncharacterized membrane protein